MKISCLAVIVASAAAEYNTADHAALHEHEYGTNVQVCDTQNALRCVSSAWASTTRKLT
jgi:hypothetical protein